MVNTEKSEVTGMGRLMASIPERASCLYKVKQ